MIRIAAILLLTRAAWPGTTASKRCGYPEKSYPPSPRSGIRNRGTATVPLAQANVFLTFRLPADLCPPGARGCRVVDQKHDDHEHVGASGGGRCSEGLIGCLLFLDRQHRHAGE